jgi:hypothetical protein
MCEAADADFNYWAYNSEGVGIVRIAQSGRVEAQVDGRHYRLSSDTPPVSSGMVKDQQPRR